MPVDMELEAVLRPMQYPMPPYPPKVITLANGKKMVVRQAAREDVPAILKSVHPCLFIERDYYDIVSARLYGDLLAAKMEYHLEYLGQDEVLIVAESPIGFRRWMVEYPLEPTRIPHELGGGDSWVLTRNTYFNAKPRLVVGDRPVPQELMDEAMADIKFADDDTIRERIAGLKGR